MDGSNPIGMSGSGGDAMVHPRDVLRLLDQEHALLGFELHDGLVQDITGARMQLESLLVNGKIPSGPLRESLARVVDLLRRAVEEARRLIDGLRPPELDEKGLIGAISSLTADQPEGGPKIGFVAHVPMGRVDPCLERMVFRIVQEAVTNVRRHSGSERAEVRLNQVADRLEIVVQDWGAGFDPAQVAKDRLGLKGICQRARLLGGRAEVDSRPGNGTRLVVELPLADLACETPVMNDRSVL
jgi:signal transduction histidine kinase